MRIVELESRTPECLDRLLEVWERSVKATHTFLSGGEVEAIKAYVPQALREVPRLVAGEDERGVPIGFLGADGQRLEMLFLLPEARGKGLGRALLQYGMDRYGLRELAVNEQNPQARGFYERMGFHVYRRTETDEQGGPYPLLYMRL
ncbi:GNAT family N-acetyltransferase [Oscillibacter sp.]|jgi:putative acetyltransferase|uniref:GNAT family N-acetyltransferase n=1 Tax=Oscillibacter sp. TaxID=1945593 RepID=UPI002171BE29|nr:GNAT family N-acetyltransferase [Oscillibacter sp.]MCI9241728.1 GNAT family N-acetyltransferase [Oscillibacter sp.]